METRAGLAAENADFGPRILEINNGGIAGAQQLVNTRPQIVNNYIHIVPDDGPNNVPHDDMDEPPELSEEDDDSSDDETYVDEMLDDEESLYYDGEEENGEDDDNIEEVRTSRGRVVRPPSRYREGVSRLSVGGLHFQAVSAVINGLMHFSIGQDDLSMPIPVYPDEIKVLHVIMMQLSLREGLKRFGEWGKKGALNEMQQLHDMTTFFQETQNL